jgi:hypothetical protein
MNSHEALLRRFIKPQAKLRPRTDGTDALWNANGRPEAVAS